MKKIILILFLFISILFSFDSKIQAAYAIGIFHENGDGENIQHKKITLQNYNGVCFSKIVVFGDFDENNTKIEVKIGDSIGHFQSKISIYDAKKIKIAEELTFKHFTISKGYFELRVDNKLYDSKVFIK